MTEAEKQLAALHDQVLGIMFDALTKPETGFHSGNAAARDEAIGASYRRIRERVDRVHAAYVAFARDQVAAAKKPTETKK